MLNIKERQCAVWALWSHGGASSKLGLLERHPPRQRLGSAHPAASGKQSMEHPTTTIRRKGPSPGGAAGADPIARAGGPRRGAPQRRTTRVWWLEVQLPMTRKRKPAWREPWCSTAWTASGCLRAHTPPARGARDRGERATPFVSLSCNAEPPQPPSLLLQVKRRSGGGVDSR
jgi:hypothetical protein